MIFNLFNTLPPNGTAVTITDDMKQDAKTFLETMLKHAYFNPMVIINNDHDSTIYLIIEDEYETARIIGKDGQTLLAFQVVVQSYLAKKYQQHVPIFIDCNDYFSYRVEKAQEKAKELASHLSSDRPSIELFPMTAIERRAIHSMYKDHDDIATHSVGTRQDRRIVLTLKHE